jgi:hypothetical protein
VRDAFGAAGRFDEPRGVATFHAALGPDADDLVEQTIGKYYAWRGAAAVDEIVGSAASHAGVVAERIEAYAAAGASEIVIVPCSADLGQLERIADAALPAHPDPSGHLWREWSLTSDHSARN